MKKIKIDAADRVFSRYIRKRDGECRRCHTPVQFRNGTPISHQASHFQGRRKEATRFDEENVDTLCFSCHQYFTEKPGEHFEWQVKTKGKEKVDAIILRSNLPHKRDRMMAKIYWDNRYKDLSRRQDEKNFK